MHEEIILNILRLYLMLLSVFLIETFGVFAENDNNNAWNQNFNNGNENYNNKNNANYDRAVWGFEQNNKRPK